MLINKTLKMKDSGPVASPINADIATATGVAVLAVLFQLVPRLGESFQWQRGGSPLAFLTCHLTHWSWAHLVWDLAAFAALSFAAIRLIPQRFLLCLLVAWVVIPLEIALNQPQFETYRGLSGIDSALLGLIIVGLWKLRHTARGIAVIATIVFVSKTIYELVTGDTVFVEQSQQMFIPAISAHVSGFLAGLVAGLLPAFGRDSCGT